MGQGKKIDSGGNLAAGASCFPLEPGKQGPEENKKARLTVFWQTGFFTRAHFYHLGRGDKSKEVGAG